MRAHLRPASTADIATRPRFDPSEIIVHLNACLGIHRSASSTAVT
jgi:hypothetical protein